MRADRILCCDAVEGMRTLPDNCIPMTLTSPPYGKLRPFGGHQWDFEVFRAIAQELYRVTTPGGVIVWVVRDAIVDGGESGACFSQALYFVELGLRLHETLIMDRPAQRHPGRGRYSFPPEFAFVLSKGRPRAINLLRDRPNKAAGKVGYFNHRGPNGRVVCDGVKRVIAPVGLRGLVWSYAVAGRATTRDLYAYEHPARMAEKMAQDLILSWSRPGDLILDPMVGSGTTCKMALLNHRRYLGFEVHEPYHRIAERRLRDAHAEYRRQLDAWLSAGPSTASLPMAR